MPVASLTDLYYLQASTWTAVSACYPQVTRCSKIVMYIVTLHDYLLLSHYITNEYQFLNYLMLYYHLINAQTVL